MSNYGWCWRCAERDGMSRGVEYPGDEGPLCERCRQEQADIKAMAATSRLGQPDDYRRVTRLRFHRRAS